MLKGEAPVKPAGLATCPNGDGVIGVAPPPSWPKGVGAICALLPKGLGFPPLAGC